MLYNSILLPIDIAHPEGVPEMVEKAKALLAEGGQITVVHAIPDIPSYITLDMPDGFLPTTMRKAEQTLNELVSGLDIEPRIKILTGQAPRAILDAADSLEAELIIVSSHRPGIADYLLGSTAARVVRHAQCSVLVLR